MMKVNAVRHMHTTVGAVLSLKTRSEVFSFTCPVLPTDTRLVEVIERYVHLYLYFSFSIISSKFLLFQTYRTIFTLSISNCLLIL